MFGGVPERELQKYSVVKGVPFLIYFNRRDILGMNSSSIQNLPDKFHVPGLLISYFSWFPFSRLTCPRGVSRPLSGAGVAGTSIKVSNQMGPVGTAQWGGAVGQRTDGIPMCAEPE